MRVTLSVVLWSTFLWRLQTALGTAIPGASEQNVTHSEHQTTSTWEGDKEDEKRLWGSKNPPESSTAGKEPGTESTSEPSVPPRSMSGAEIVSTLRSEVGPTHIPFVSKKANNSTTVNTTALPPTHTLHHDLPKAFRIAARVYTDTEDKLSHFDNDSDIVFPYRDCGSPGWTTVPIPLQHATIRHLLGGAHPNLYSGDEFGPHPQLIVAVTALEIVLNSGMVQVFQPGDVILLEDVLSGGHKLQGHDHQEMTVMVLTLKQHYHYVGKDKSCLPRSSGDNDWNIQPCPDDFGSSAVLDSPSERRVGRHLIRSLPPRALRQYLLAVIGLGLSTLLGDFMGRVAPLWLAVVFGGGCLVTGGTVAFVKGGEYVLDELEMWQERRLLETQELAEDPTDERFPRPFQEDTE